MNLLQHFGLGFGISFLFYLPCGSVNLITADLALRKGMRLAMYLATGATLVELVYALLALNSSRFIDRYLKDNAYINLGVAIALLVLGIIFLSRKPKPRQDTQATKPQAPLTMFTEGLLLGVLNLPALPLWLFVVRYLQQNRWAQWTALHETIFVVGIVIARFLILRLYGKLGIALEHRLSNIQVWSNRVIGGIFLALSAYQGYAFLS
ncbi:Threonine/homoserine/homoserine lactone efflux protein [Catalinimonas alkaloidigena]|uniref:Threonine/homoserine/homoserine lactone efflux protein n=1 Tax=Catalinimonas alkaloidigena TaxID=1075417 RepID=A0A1G9MRI2_9BACT|nr:LysE family transporter [Catalinimonas alkaloidigena]SDL76868.1 Threonine/homoserine/homoserine lactone efflux protein [Catalinimonas alkaloidigena]